MGIFDINGKAITKGYDVSGNTVSALYDITGNQIDNGQSEAWDGLSAERQTMLDTAMSYCASYTAENPQSYAFPLITDGHQAFTGREPAYIEHRHPEAWSRMLFLGDMCNSYDSTQLDNAVAFMGSTTINKIIAMGNHELGNWAEGDTLPEEWYKPLLDPISVLWGGGDGLIYYSDDNTNNVRYIVLDSCTPIYKSAGVLKFTKDQLEWCASVMESAGTKDIIICNHAMGSSFYLVTDTAKEDSKSDTTVTNSGTLWALINAFISKGTYSVTDDSGIPHAHDFSETSGHFIGYFTGHYHHAGHTDASGFHKFTAPMLRTPYSGLPQGLSFFIVDKAQKKIVWLICWYADASISTYEFNY